MALIHVMLGTARTYAQFGEHSLAKRELIRALETARRMRPTRKVRIMRAYIQQAIGAL